MPNKAPKTAPVRKITTGHKKKTPRSSPGRATPVPRPHRKTEAPPARQTGPGSPPEKTGSTKFTFHVNPTLTLMALPDDAPVLFSLEAAASLTGVHPEMLRYYWRAGLVDAFHSISESELVFEEGALHEIRRIEHYRRHLAVSRRALPLICELRREADRQHIEIQFLQYP